MKAEVTERGKDEKEQDPMVLAHMTSACLLFVEKLQPKSKFNQRIEKMQKQRQSKETK